MVEHADIARRLARGEGYLLGVKAYQLGGSEVVEDGLLHRPPLLTWMIAGLFALGYDLQVAQALHSLVGAVSAVLVYSLGRQLFGLTVGIAAGVLAAVCPFAFKTQAPLMTEGLSTMFTLVGVRLLVGAVDRPRLLPFTLAGLAFGLGYLARPPVLAVFAAAIVATFLVARDRRGVMRPVVGMLAGAALVIAPMSLFSFLTRGRWIYSGKTYLYAVANDRDVIEEAFSRPVESPIEFIAQNLGFVLQTIAGLFYTYARWIFTDPEWLLPLLPGWPLAMLALVKGRYPHAVWIPLAVAGANYGFYSLTWASWQDRFMLPTLLLLLPFGVDGLLRTIRLIVGAAAAFLARPRLLAPTPNVLLGFVVLGIVGFWLPQFTQQYRGQFAYFDRPAGTRTDAGLRWTGPPRWVNDDDFKNVVAWADTRTDRDAILAAAQPWPLGLFADRPAVLVPINLREPELRRFIVENRISHFLLDGRDPRRKPYRDYLDDLEEDGVRATKIGAVTAYDTRTLWR